KNSKPSALVIIFGATGDLANRKLFPSLFQLYKKGRLSEHFAVVGVARRDITTEQFRETVRHAVMDGDSEQGTVDEFSSHFYYHSHDVAKSKSCAELKTLADQLDGQYQLGGNRIFYLAMAPEFF